MEEDIAGVHDVVGGWGSVGWELGYGEVGNEAFVASALECEVQVTPTAPRQQAGLRIEDAASDAGGGQRTHGLSIAAEQKQA